MSMGVYIKGMEMPKDCLHCCFASGCSYCDGYNDHCAFEPDDIKTDWDFAHGVFPETTPDWCPLVPVSPHGRLIDADVLKEKWTHRDLDLFAQGWGYLQDLNRAPTILPAEEAAK